MADPRQEQWYLDAVEKRGAISIGEPVYAQDQILVRLSQAVISGDGKSIQGVAATDLRVDGLKPALASCSLRDGDTAWLANREGYFLIHPDPNVLPGPDRPGQNVSVVPQGREILDAHLNAHSGSEMVRAGAWQYFFATSSESGFLVILQVSTAELREPVERIRQNDIGIYLVTVLVLLVALGLLANRLLRPIPVLLHAVDRAERGQDSGAELREVSRRSDEFGKLARGFEEMVSQVHEREDQLRGLSEALELNERRTRALVENAADVLLRLDSKHCCSYVSPALTRDLGHAPDQWIGRPLGSLIDPRDRDKLEHALHNSSIGGRLAPIEVRVQHANGEMCQVEVNIMLHLEGESILIGLRDVTERERARQYKLEVDAADAANRAKSAFLANMSHELRTPLNAIIGYSEILIEEAPDSGLEDFLPDLERIHTSGKNLLTLINDILDLSKIEAGKMPVYAETFELQALLKEIVREVEGRKEKDVELRVQMPPEPILLYSDKSRVRQCVLNILDNACKFTHQGHIEVRAQEAYERVSIEVEDTGIGIKPELLERLFEPFVMGDSSATRKYGGTGLGLLLTRRVVQLIDGEVWVKSTPDQGSTFTLELPLHSSMIGDLQKPGDSGEKSRRTPRVLVIDDDPQVLELMRRTLEKEGFEVNGASSGPEGLRKAREWRPDAITLDVMMPDVDGWTVLGQLKNDPDLSSIPVVLVTFAGDRGPGLTLGAAEQLEKPIQRDRLVTVLQRLCPAGPGRVLVVDDDANNRELFQRTLSQEGWTVETAENGRQALDRMKGDPTRLVILDLMMPEVDGFEVLEKMHQNPQWASVPVVVVTAKELTDEERAYLTAHTARLVDRKEFSTEQLVDWLRQVSA
jgi:PAS domain S-box-containing protein